MAAIAAFGSEMAWTSEISAEYLPASVEGGVARAASACPDVAETKRYLECDEYPCLLWVETRAGEAGTAFDDCASWPYEGRFLEYEGHYAPGEEFEYAILAILDGRLSVGEQENFLKRVDYRTDFYRSVVLEQWGLNGL